MQLSNSRIEAGVKLDVALYILNSKDLNLQDVLRVTNRDVASGDQETFAFNSCIVNCHS